MILETFINKALALDARTTLRLKELEGKRLDINFSDLGKTFHIQFTNQGIHILKKQESPADATVCGPIKAFVSFAFTKNTFEAAKKGLAFEGDVATLEAIKTLFLTVDIDWEEPLARWTSDPIAHQVGNFARFFQNRQKAFFQSTAQSASEYLIEETRFCPSKIEVDDFMNAVDGVCADTDRLQARLELYMRRSNKEQI